MLLTVVGSGTAAPDAERTGACFLVETGELRLLLDCGPGASHHMARYEVPWPRITHIAISHFHADHLAGLPALLFALKYALAPARTEPLTILGPPGTQARMRALSEAFGSFVLDPGFRTQVRELGPGSEVDLPGQARLRVAKTAHTDASLAYRLDAPGSALGYTGDTGPDDALGPFFQGVDALLAECSLPDGDAVDAHLTPGRVARLAAAANPGRLLLTHVYPRLDRAAIPGLVRSAGWEGEVVVVKDGDRLEVGAGH